MKISCSHFAIIGASLLLVANAAEVKPKESIAGIWLMGQSLCDGSESLPVVSTNDTGWGNYAFRRGVRTWLPKDHSGTPEKRPAEQFQFVPLRAQANAAFGSAAPRG